MPFIRTSEKRAPLRFEKSSSRRYYSRLFMAGMLGAFLISVVTWLGVWIQWSPFTLEMLLGSLITGSTGTGSWLLGFGWHLINGGLFALAYGWFFDLLGKGAPAIGAALGLVHWVLAGILFSLIQTFHPIIGETLWIAGGVFYWIGSESPVLWGSLIVHLGFGSLMGAIARNQLPARSTTSPESAEELEKAHQKKIAS